MPGCSDVVWWGWIPGETTYLWAFPNEDRIVRLGLTMPFSIDVEGVDDRERYRLLRPEDEHIPQGSVYLRRLLEEVYGDEYDIGVDFPLVEDRGKTGGTESYSISSTRPIDSPTRAGVAVAGGAMGTTSAFHEGGDHVAIRTGTLAGQLAAEGRLDEYNDAWKAAIGKEIVRNLAVAELVQRYTPEDWDRAFTVLREMGFEESSLNYLRLPSKTGFAALSLYRQNFRNYWRFRGDRFTQLHENEFVY